MRHGDAAGTSVSSGQRAGAPHLLQGGVLARVLLMQPLHQALHHAGLHMQQDVPPVVAGHHAVLQQEEQVPQRQAHFQRGAHGGRDAQHAQLSGERSRELARPTLGAMLQPLAPTSL